MDSYEFDELLDAKLDTIIDIKAQIANLQLVVGSKIDKFLYQHKGIMTEKESQMYAKLLTELRKDVTRMQGELIKLAKTEARMVLECQQLKAAYKP